MSLLRHANSCVRSATYLLCSTWRRTTWIPRWTCWKSQKFCVKTMSLGKQWLITTLHVTTEELENWRLLWNTLNRRWVLKGDCLKWTHRLTRIWTSVLYWASWISMNSHSIMQCLLWFYCRKTWCQKLLMEMSHRKSQKKSQSEDQMEKRRILQKTE